MSSSKDPIGQGHTEAKEKSCFQRQDRYVDPVELRSLDLQQAWIAPSRLDGKHDKCKASHPTKDKTYPASTRPSNGDDGQQGQDQGDNLYRRYLREPKECFGAGQQKKRSRSYG